MSEGVEIITEQPQGFHAASDATGNATEKNPALVSFASRMSRSAHYKRLAVSGLAFNDLLYLTQSHPKHVRYAAPQ